MYYPDHTYYYPPEEHGYTQQDVRFKAQDGTELFGWFFKAKTKSKGTIIQFHGNGQNISSHYASLVWLTDQGYNLFTFDYRSYGKSRGSPSPENNAKDGIDAISVARKLHEQSGGGKFIVYAQSLGVAVALKSVENEKFDLFVADSGFLSYKSVFSQTLAKNWLTFLFSWIPYLTISDEYAPLNTVGHLRGNLLVIHDRYDPVVKFANGQELYDKTTAASRKDFWITEKGNHIAVFIYDNGAYRKKFLDYLDQIR